MPQAPVCTCAVSMSGVRVARAASRVPETIGCICVWVEAAAHIFPAVASDFLEPVVAALDEKSNDISRTMPRYCNFITDTKYTKSSVTRNLLKPTGMRENLNAHTLCLSNGLKETTMVFTVYIDSRDKAVFEAHETFGNTIQSVRDNVADA